MSWWDGAFNWITHVIAASASAAAGGISYIDPTDNDEDDTSQLQYTTVVTYKEPLRTTKCMFVNEMGDFYSEEELNQGYHRKKEYDESLDKYGFIYKSQKFSNADTPQKLFDYAKDWIKNNYHGGLTSFTITALDMHLTGDSSQHKYTVGKRARVKYPDPGTHEEAEQVLTVISAEYDLYNPDKNQYKIGIPDITLSKVYGETSKKGGGGGGGKNTSSDNDTDDGTELEGLTDGQDSTTRGINETTWAFMKKMANGGATPEEVSEYIASNFQTPGEADPGSDFTYALVSDIMKTGDFKTAIADITSKLTAKYIVSKGAVEAKKVETNEGNITNIVSELVKSTDGEFDNIKIDGKSFKPYVYDGKVKLVINGSTYTITPD